jgi:hypothetical protein
MLHRFWKNCSIHDSDLLYREKGKKAAATRRVALFLSRQENLEFTFFEVGTKLATLIDIRLDLLVGIFFSTDIFLFLNNLSVQVVCL